MVKRGILAAVGAALLLLVVFIFPTDTRRIKKLLRNTSAWAQKAPEDQPVVVAAKSKKARDLFMPKVHFALERRSFEEELDIPDIERGYLLLMQSRKSFKMTFEDVGVEVLNDIAAEGTATVLIETDGPEYAGLSSVNECLFGFEKSEEGWRIKSVVVKEVLEK